VPGKFIGKFKKAIKVITVGALIILPVLFLFPQTTHAAVFGLLPDLSPGGITAAVFRVLAFILNVIFGLLFILGGALVNMMMHLNANILNQENALVGVGWTISRDVANLGFVLVMIIMAVATILRYEKFSAKSLLPKLIGAAIIVNFSLTIAGVFITFSNSLTNVFLNGKMSGDMVAAIDNAFGPQKLLLPPENPPPPDPSQQGSAAGGVTAAVLTSIAGLVFTTLFTALAAFVMIVLAFMLMVRYIYLSFLLIVAPLVWLFWVFPPLNKLFGEWWSKFLNWVFFAPAVTFFIYIALTSAKFLGSVSISTASFGSALETAFSQGAQMLILGGIMLGGIIAAQSMGIAGAGAAIKLAQGAGNKAKKWAQDTSTRVAQRAATAPLRAGPAKNFAERLQKSNFRLARVAGNAMSRGGVIQGEQLVKKATASQKDMSDKQLALRVRDLKGEGRVAALSRLSKNGTLSLVPEGVAKYINNDTKDKFSAYGQDKAYGDMEKSVGFNTDMLTAKTEEDFNKALQQFVKGFSIKDFDKLQGNILSKFNDEKNHMGLDKDTHEKIRGNLEQAIFEFAPGSVSKIRPKLKGENLTDFNRDLNQYIKDVELDELQLPLTINMKKPKEKLEYIESQPNLRQHADRMRALYGTQKNMGGSLFGSWSGTGAGGGTTDEDES
jgi:hypothetical protein